MTASSPASDLYERDFYAWSQVQARELRRLARTRPNVPLDLSHLAEEIADLGKERRNSLRTRTQRIMERLLLLEHSTALGPRAQWIGEVADLRMDIELRLSKALTRDLQRQLPKLYEAARRVVTRKMEAYGETAAVEQLPKSCPYMLEQVLEGWWPEREQRG
jgi:hypothetical protein